MKCQSCGKTVTKRSNFCPNCGDRIVYRRSEARPARSGSSMPMGYALALLAGGALLGFLVFKVSTGPSTPPQQMVVGGGSFQAASAIPAALMPQVQEIASQFMCPCGGCDDSLDECACDMTNGATEVKGFIAQQLQAGVAKSRIITMVSQRYGGLKTGAAPGLDFKNVK